MAFLVEITRRADEDLKEIYWRIHADNTPAAAKWFNGLEEFLYSLETLPERGAIVSGTKRCQLLYGNKPDLYRIVYSIDEKHRRIKILYVRHGARAATLAK